jgi:succinate dehydrogenase / fumarate reductase flavoprotein subunit
MGGLWVDYDLMATIPGLFVIGEANFSDHGANRLGASALMQGLADGYFILPYTIGGYLAGAKLDALKPDAPECRGALEDATRQIEKLTALKGKRTIDEIHRELGMLLWDKCGMSRSAAGLLEAKRRIPELREAFWKEAIVLGGAGELNLALEQAGRVADFLELAELIVDDAIHRAESCGCHFREESQTPENEALRDDARFSHVAAWEFKGVGEPSVPHKEPLTFEHVKPTTRSYK